MKISFVIPAYNEETHLRACLESILREARSSTWQTEIIVVNNASSDGTGALAASFPGVIVVDEPKKGLVQARHSGYSVSVGEIIANIDADTRLPEGWLTRVISEFERNPQLAALSGPYIYYDLSVFSRILVRLFYFFGFVIYLLNRFVLRVGSMLQGGNFIVRRSALEKIGGFDTSIDFYGEDTDIARRLSAVGDVKFTFGLPAFSSGRRLAKEGIIVTGLRYAANYISVIFLKKPMTKSYQDIRE
jgi:glycosyltransferase involved in cell wall biosynthesis